MMIQVMRCVSWDQLYNSEMFDELSGTKHSSMHLGKEAQAELNNKGEIEQWFEFKSV